MRSNLFVCAALSLCCAHACGRGPDPVFGEAYRPGYHYSPREMWMNEPNGLVFHQGVYHLFYQHNPFNNQWGNMSWGHATSTDLVRWEHQTTKLPGEDGIMSFTGTAIYDDANTSGLGEGDRGPLIAAYTGWDYVTRIQDQRLAFSNDNGETWTKFAGNPVLDIGSVEIRDPKIVWHGDSGQWVMVLAHGGQNRMTFWGSPNLIDWTYLSEFTSAGMPGNISGWEVPDFFEMPVDGDANDTRWVLVVTPARGSPAGGNGVFYVVGGFDGTTFTNDNPASLVLWAEYGRDFDGPLSWEHEPQGRRIWAGIMNSYGTNVPTTPWRGNVSIPRELTLETTTDGVRMVQRPIDELETLRASTYAQNNLVFNAGDDPLDGAGVSGDMLEIIAEFAISTSTAFGVSVREGNGQSTRIGYDVNDNEMFVDRRNSGRPDLPPETRGVQIAPLSPDGNSVRMHIFVDRSSVEAFGHDGRAVISNLIFPDPTSVGVSLFAEGGFAFCSRLEIHTLDAVWNPEGPPAPGSDVVAQWDLAPVPQAGASHNPITIDKRKLEGEGIEGGIGDPFYEPDPRSDHLWMLNSLEGGRYPWVAESAPDIMYVNRNKGGVASFKPFDLANADGALFYPFNLYGDEFAFTDAFSLEVMFRTQGDRSGAGLQQLILQGEDSFRYGLILNEGGPGNVRFAIRDAHGVFETVDISSVSGLNYADGNWHYALAVFDPASGLRLTLANEDGSSHTARQALGGAFGGMAPGPDGNLLIGREDFLRSGGDNGTARTLLGLIDQVQITRGVVSPEQRLGRVALCLADWDENLVLNTLDFIAYLNEWSAGDIAADLTSDGEVNTLDFIAFLTSFGAGC